MRTLHTYYDVGTKKGPFAGFPGFWGNLLTAAYKAGMREFDDVGQHRVIHRISLGSVTEAESHVIIASDLELIDADDFAHLIPQIEDVRKMLTGLAKRLTSDANRQTGKKAGRR